MSSVNGPSNRAPVSTGPGSAEQVDPQQPTPRAPNQPLDLSPRLGRDGFATAQARQGAAVNLEGAPPDLAQKALETFNSRISDIFIPSAADLARGERPIAEGDTLTPAQLDQVKSATVDLLQDLPVTALPEGLAETVRDLLGPKGEGLDFSQTSIRQLKKLLGERAGDVAKGWVNDLKAKSPATFYGVAAGAALALGYTQGSEGFTKLGIRPEFKTDLSNHVDLEVAAAWEKGFKDWSAKGKLSAHGQLGDAKLAGSLSYDTRTGATVAAGSVTLTKPDFSLSAAANYDFSTGAGTASLNGRYQVNPNFSLSAGVSHNFADHSTSANLGATYRRGDFDFALSASASERERRVGVGVTWRF